MKTTKFYASLLMGWITMSTIACFAEQSPDVATNEIVIRKYYTAYEKKDWHMLEQILADGFTFTSPAGDDHIEFEAIQGEVLAKFRKHP
jgi:hypothetical protein